MELVDFGKETARKCKYEQKMSFFTCIFLIQIIDRIE